MVLGFSFAFAKHERNLNKSPSQLDKGMVTTEKCNLHYTGNG